MQRSWLGLDDRLSWRAYTCLVSMQSSAAGEQPHLELPVEELLRRARPLPTSGEMVIEDLSTEEGAAFLAAIDS